MQAAVLRERGLFLLVPPLRSVMNSLHPATRLACWAMLVLAIQCLGGRALALACAGMLLSGRPVVAHWFRLLRRTRWLMLSLLAVLGWSVAGEPLWEGGMPAPTYEGLAEALLQSGRLVLVLAAVALLLETTPVAVLMAGCRHLLLPLRRVGLDVERAVARLTLTLRYAESLPPVSGWRQLLDEHAPVDAVTASVRVDGGTFGVADMLALGGALTLLALAVLA